MMDSPILTALRNLAGMCDGGRRRDEVGFNAFDADFGGKLARQEILTPRQAHAAWRMIRKYKRQLAGFGIDYDSIEEPDVNAAPPKLSRQVYVDKGDFCLKFEFDPALNAQLALVPTARWLPSIRAHKVTARFSVLKELSRFVVEHKFECTDEVNVLTQRLIDEQKQIDKARADAIAASSATDADITVKGLGGDLRRFQCAGVDYGMRAKRTFIADEMGLGKTIEALAIVQALNAYPSLCVVPANLKLNWAAESRKWLPGKFVYVIDGRTPPTKHAQVSIVNYDILQKHRDALLRIPFKSIIFDESHYLKSATTQRTCASMEIAHGCIYARDEKGRMDMSASTVVNGRIPVRLLLTGTPILNETKEWIPQLNIMDRLEEIGGYSFVAGAIGKQLEEVNHRLRACCYIRRRKVDVLKDLPLKQRAIITLPISNRSEYQRAENELITYLREQAVADSDFQESIKGLAEHEQAQAKKHRADTAERKARRAEQLVRINALKKVAVRGKMEAAEQWIDNFLDGSEEKILLFAWYQEIVERLAQTYKCDAIYGEVSKIKRDKAVTRFQTCPEPRTLALNIKTGGVGLTLTAASNVGILELGWNPGTMDQCEDRTHRIGQTKQVTAWYLIAEGTIEEEILDLIEKKRGITTAVIEGEEHEPDFKMMNELVERLLNKKGQESLL